MRKKYEPTLLDETMEIDDVVDLLMALTLYKNKNDPNDLIAQELRAKVDKAIDGLNPEQLEDLFNEEEVQQEIQQG